MLKLKKLILENFGPFKGLQDVDLPDDNGVIVVYGENMRGKTTLLNAIRYALFGTVLTRKAQPLTFNNIENWESASEGKHGFKVVLRFSYNGADYELTRECRLGKNVTSPKSDADYEQIDFLKKNTEVLGPDAAEIELVRIMPESVSRFFLFDGELLQQYEELLRDESTMGRQIKDSIERILGVPVLTTGRSNLKRLLDEAQKSESKAAQKNLQTQELGNHHARLIEERLAHETELNRLKNDLSKLKSQKRAIEEVIKKTEHLKSLFAERDTLQKGLNVIDNRQSEKEARLREILSTAWKSVLKNRIKTELKATQKEIDSLREKISTSTFAEYYIKKINEGIEKDYCPTCEQPLNEISRKILDDLRKKFELPENAKDYSEKINKLTSRQAVLHSVESPDVIALIREITDSIEELQMERYVKKERIDEIREATKSVDESKQRELQAEYDRTVADVLIVEQGIDREQEELTKIELSIQKIEKKLDLLGVGDLKTHRRRRELSKRLYDIFNEAVDVYRDELRGRVEEDASVLFLELTTEPEYSGLKINQNYGLTILHSDGGLIPVRSAGAEHIVALSLMGALQRNAPLRGPIIMDSPFGRLDDMHTTKVVKTLPQMADQVILLVYESEMNPKIARNHLRGSLKREYQIIRQSARHSSIEVRNE